MSEPGIATAAALRQALRDGRAAEAVSDLRAMPPVRRAELFLRLRDPDQKILLAVAPPELAASILADSDSASLAPLLQRYDLGALRPTLRLVPPEDLADILLHLPEARREEALGALEASAADEVRRLMTFDPGTAGGLMTPRYLSVPDVVTVARALELLRAGREAASASYVYVVDAQGRLSGVVPLRELVLANPRKAVSEIMVSGVLRLRSSAPAGEVDAAFAQHHYLSIPVVDDRDRLVGIVTAEDARRLAREREDLVLRGVTGIDPVRERVKETLAATRGRLPWLGVTIAGGLGCALIGKLFERTLEELVMLGIFTPLVLALGESVGAQTATVVLSAEAGGALAGPERAAFVRKELTVGVLVALLAGSVVALLSLLWHGNPRLGLLIGASILLSMVWAVALAVVLPGLLLRLRMNAEIASGPLVLTIADLSTLGVYFGSATLSMEFLRP